MSALKIRKASGLDTVTLIIPDKKIFEYILRNFVSKNYAAQKAIEIFPHARETVFDDLRGVFDKNELIYLIEVFKMEKFPDIVPSTSALKTKIEYAEKLANLSGKQKVDFPVLLEKVDNLSNLQAIFLSEWASTFTYLKGKSKLSNYLKILLKEGVSHDNI